MPSPAASPAAVDLSLVVPVFNEAENLPPLHAEIERALAPLGLAWEVVYVDDGSRDASLETLRRIAAGDRRVRVLHLRRNSGQSAAFAAGFRAARGAVVVTLDADLQNDPADIPLLLARARGRRRGVRRARRPPGLLGAARSRRASPTRCATG